MIDFSPSLDTKGFFRFTGPPENWLTAIKYMTWGLERKYLERWKEIQPGDVFLIHSTGASASLFNNAKSGIIGLGVIGANFSVKDNYLWIHEMKDQKNRWPLLVPFSEIYLFSELPSRKTWAAPSPENITETKRLVDLLVKNRIPLSNVEGFPQMGSFSSVTNEVARKILYDKKPLYLYSEGSVEDIKTSKPTELKEIKNVSESLRFADTLKVFDTVNKRVVKESVGQYTKDNELLSKAENIHATILQGLIDLFRNRGYDTRCNRFVDLFANNNKKAFLIEVKSIENKNFRSQARKGIVQLFEYDYFEVRKFCQEKKLEFQEKHRILVPSKEPKDKNYIDFINNLKLGVGLLDNKNIKPVGEDFGFSKI